MQGIVAGQSILHQYDMVLNSFGVNEKIILNN